jgi:NDP-sugar pyrophosphorylase family protein
MYLLHTKLLETIPAERAVSIERELFPAWLEQGMYGYKTAAPFIDIGTPESYRQATHFLLKLRRAA